MNEMVGPNMYIRRSSMIVGRRKDGEIILLAKDHSLPPLMRSSSGEWMPALIYGSELDEFAIVWDEVECQEILRSAKLDRERWIEHCLNCGAEKSWSRLIPGLVVCLNGCIAVRT